uniref:Uncharacterized protein n=1 Tax=Arundo donax TaxID=35708 RepID=A0A0A9HAY9_ARUDO
MFFCLGTALGYIKARLLSLELDSAMQILHTSIANIPFQSIQTQLPGHT